MHPSGTITSMKTGDWVRVENPTVPLNVRAHQHPDDPHPVRLRNVVSIMNRHIGLTVDHGDPNTFDLTLPIRGGRLTTNPVDPPPPPPDFSAAPNAYEHRAVTRPYVRHVIAQLLLTPTGASALAAAGRDLEAQLSHDRHGHIPTATRRGLALLAAVDAGLNPALLPPLSDAAATWTGTTADLLRAYQAASTND